MGVSSRSLRLCILTFGTFEGLETPHIAGNDILDFSSSVEKSDDQFHDGDRRINRTVPVRPDSLRKIDVVG